jgi:3-isopropylmalate dehydrogenase
MGVERCIRYAFELARPERKHLTLVHKTNVLTFAGDLWERTFDEVAAEYPDVTTAYNHVDAACIYFVQDPQRYDVIVTDNLFGDILTDLGGAVSGGIGWRRRPTSTPPAPARRCSSRCTARRPTSSGRTRPTPPPPSCRAH